MRFECPSCKKWPPMSDASFCCYCGIRFSDYKFEPAELANNYRRFAIKYFWFITVPVMFASFMGGALLTNFLPASLGDDPTGSIGMIPFTLSIVLVLLHFSWWSRKKFPNHSR